MEARHGPSDFLDQPLTHSSMFDLSTEDTSCSPTSGDGASESTFATRCLVSRLPIEVLSIVFESCLPYPGGVNLYQKTLTGPWALGAVCRDWRALVLASPRLWASLTIKTIPKEGEILRALELTTTRAGSTSFDITLASYTKFPPTFLEAWSNMRAFSVRFWAPAYIANPPNFTRVFQLCGSNLRDIRLCQGIRIGAPAEVFNLPSLSTLDMGTANNVLLEYIRAPTLRRFSGNIGAGQDAVALITKFFKHSGRGIRYCELHNAKDVDPYAEVTSGLSDMFNALPNVVELVLGVPKVSIRKRRTSTMPARVLMSNKLLMLNYLHFGDTDMPRLRTLRLELQVELSSSEVLDTFFIPNTLKDLATRDALKRIELDFLAQDDAKPLNVQKHLRTAFMQGMKGLRNSGVEVVLAQCSTPLDLRLLS